MIKTRAAFASGMIFTLAIIASIRTRSKHKTFSQWWNSDGIAIWIIAAMIGGSLLVAQ